MELIDFMEKVDQSTNCWNWIGAIGKGGYGNLKFNGRYANAHRISWILHFGEISPGLHVCHRCDNRRCVRLEHLFLGTRSENMIDASQKGRLSHANRSGEKNGRAKLTAHDVAQIRAEHQPRIVTAKMLGRQYGVAKGTIDRILQGKGWN